MCEHVLFSWSGGKDSTLALYKICREQQYSNYDITHLLTVLTEGYDRISGHGVRRTLLEHQVAALDHNLHALYISRVSSIEEYESVVAGAASKYHQEEGASAMVFGDIFLKHLKKRRMQSLEQVGMKGVFPLWQKNSRDIIKQFIALGFKAFVVCIDAKVLDKSFVGRQIDEDFLNQLPPEIDPCGENGEYHTFVYDGPLFRERVRCKPGEIVLRDSFYFCDLIPDE